MSKAHTPGPWAWLGAPGASKLNAAHGKVFDHFSCEGMWPGAYDEEIDAANMALIAAAPEMLSELRRIQEYLRSPYFDEGMRHAIATAVEYVINKAAP